MTLSAQRLRQSCKQREGPACFTSQTRSGLLCCPSITSWAGQGATHEGLSPWIKLSHNPGIIRSSQAFLLQTRTRRSKWSKRRREPIVHAQCAYVAIRETAATYNTIARTSRQSGKGEKSLQYQEKTTSAVNAGAGCKTTGDAGCTLSLMFFPGNYVSRFSVHAIDSCTFTSFRFSTLAAVS